MRLFLRLFVPLLSHVAIVTAVTGCHSDRDKDHRPRENCTGAGFRDVPAGFDPQTKVLLFPRNQFTSLSWSSFHTFAEIYEIDLTANKVPEVPPSGAPLLPRLSVLRLGRNRLTSLSDGSFAACPALTELYLDNNALRSLRDHTFSGLSKLEILDLSSNQISVLPTLMLHPLPAIETLYLESNKITVMPDDWFSKKEEVPYLYLSANPWVCSCALNYLHRYLNDYELNVYVRDGPIIRSDSESVVCDSPQQLRSKPVVTLEESDLCSEDKYEDTSEVDLLGGIFAMTTMSPDPSSAPPHPSATILPDPTSPAAVTQMVTVLFQVVTWSWYQTFTGLFEWSFNSGQVNRGDGSVVGSRSLEPTTPTFTHTTEGPATTTTYVPIKPATSESTAGTAAAGKPELQETTPSFATEATSTTTATPTSTTTSTPTSTTTATPTPTTTSTPSRVINRVVGLERPRTVGASGAAAVFCFWLFAGCLLLCVTSAASAGATVVGLVTWYRRVYRPLSVMQARRRAGGNEGVMLSTFSSRREEEDASGGAGAMALYRSVLYVHRGGGGAEGGEEGVPANLEPTAAGGGAAREDEGEGGGKEERGVYRKTLYRLLSKEEEIEGWRDVMEECRISAGDVRRKGVGTGGGGSSKKRYSVILREEREEAGGGREELDWVVGGWEVKREDGVKEEEPRSSWGAWLAHNLPSMPWGVATPPDDDATL